MFYGCAAAGWDVFSWTAFMVNKAAEVSRLPDSRQVGGEKIDCLYSTLTRKLSFQILFINRSISVTAMLEK